RPGENARFRAKVIRYERPSDRSQDWTFDGYGLTDFQVIRVGKGVAAEVMPESEPEPEPPPAALTAPTRKSVSFAEGLKIGKELQDLFGGQWEVCREALSRLPG